MTRAAMDYYTQMPHSDDRPVHDELGIEYRPLIETFTDCLSDLASQGRISRRAAVPADCESA